MHANIVDVPCAYEDSSIQSRGDGGLVLLDRSSNLVRFILPPVFLGLFDSFQLQGVGVDAFLQLLNLVSGELVVANEQIASSYVEIALRLPT